MNSNECLTEPPKLTNTFRASRWLKSYLAWRLPSSHRTESFAELESLGEAAAGPLMELARQAEEEQPRHRAFDAHGRRVDEIIVSPAWNKLKDFSAEHGLVADGYERKFGIHSRLHQFAKLFLFHPSSAFFSCPLAMTDGAARVLEIYGKNNSIMQNAFHNLTSRQAKTFWTSGQWMTEKTGGSDVSETSTIAKPSGDRFLLSGTKWFSSATTSEMALGLARIEGSPAGSRGLTLFYIPVVRTDGALNGIEVLKLKDKLGTKALPTAELELKNCTAYPVGELNAGVKTVATMLNITRIYNSVCSIGQMARGLELIGDYAKKRKAFGLPLLQQPLFAENLFRQELKLLAGFLLTFKMAELLGKEEAGEASSEESDLLRLFTPVTKMFTAKEAVNVSSEVVEAFGGAGYIENIGISVLFRDAQVFSIWEGATNVMSLDVLRVLEKTNALESFFNEGERIVKAAAQFKPAALVQDRLANFKQALASAKPEALTLSARHIAFELARLYAGLLMLEWLTGDRTSSQRLEVALPHWLAQRREFALTPPQMTTDLRQFFDGSAT